MIWEPHSMSAHLVPKSSPDTVALSRLVGEDNFKTSSCWNPARYASLNPAIWHSLMTLLLGTVRYLPKYLIIISLVF